MKRISPWAGEKAEHSKQRGKQVQRPWGELDMNIFEELFLKLYSLN